MQYSLNYSGTRFLSTQGSKLTLANLQNASDSDNLRVRKISTSKRLRVRIIHVSQTKLPNKGRKFASGLISWLVEKILTSKTLQVR